MHRTRLHSRLLRQTSSTAPGYPGLCAWMGVPVCTWPQASSYTQEPRARTGCHELHGNNVAAEGARTQGLKPAWGRQGPPLGVLVRSPHGSSEMQSHLFARTVLPLQPCATPGIQTNPSGFVPHPCIPAASSFDPCQSQCWGRGEQAAWAAQAAQGMALS